MDFLDLVFMIEITLVLTGDILLVLLICSDSIMYVISLRHSIQYEQRIFLNSYLDTALKLYVVCTT